MSKDIKPNKAEKEFLTIAYNRFLSLYDEIREKIFWDNNDSYRFYRQKEIFFVYNELCQYLPLSFILDGWKENNVGQFSAQNDFFKFVRNIFAHFAFFDRYNDVWINKIIINWRRDGQSIDSFLIKYTGHEPIKWRVWDYENKIMNYFKINFPLEYNDSKKIYLKDFSDEKEGVLFSIDSMWRLLKTQIV